VNKDSYILTVEFFQITFITTYQFLQSFSSCSGDYFPDNNLVLEFIYFSIFVPKLGLFIDIEFT